jgi:hypothetical protein
VTESRINTVRVTESRINTIRLTESRINTVRLTVNHNNTTQKEKVMSHVRQLWDYYAIRYAASRELDRDRGEVSATTVVMAAALIALAISVGVIITNKVRDKANDLDLG